MLLNALHLVVDLIYASETMAARPTKRPHSDPQGSVPFYVVFLNDGVDERFKVPPELFDCLKNDVLVDDGLCLMLKADTNAERFFYCLVNLPDDDSEDAEASNEEDLAEITDSSMAKLVEKCARVTHIPLNSTLYVIQIEH